MTADGEVRACGFVLEADGVGPTAHDPLGREPKDDIEFTGNP